MTNPGTSNSTFRSNASGANVTGNTHKHIGQDCYITNNYNHCQTYNNCHVFNGTNSTASAQTGTALDDPNDTSQTPVTQNRPPRTETAVWAALGLFVFGGGSLFDIIRRIFRRQLLLFALFNRGNAQRVNGAIAEEIRAGDTRDIGDAVENAQSYDGAESYDIGDATVNERSRDDDSYQF